MWAHELNKCTQTENIAVVCHFFFVRLSYFGYLDWRSVITRMYAAYVRHRAARRSLSGDETIIRHKLRAQRRSAKRRNCSKNLRTSTSLCLFYGNVQKREGLMKNKNIESKMGGVDCAPYFSGVKAVWSMALLSPLFLKGHTPARILRYCFFLLVFSVSTLSPPNSSIT